MSPKMTDWKTPIVKKVNRNDADQFKKGVTPSRPEHSSARRPDIPSMRRRVTKWQREGNGQN